ncbi:MAG TPA: ATP-binding cassette domain-containing protein [Caulobacteraceae bacterium]|nr:ATP-binding cassette domain-containing protein [Caulobacteraceae bacterium]
MAAPTIELDQVSKSFDGGRVFAVREVSLSAEAGAFIALVGGSGSGKTTTLKMINRLIEPTSGAVRLEGEPVEGLEPHVLRRRIGYVFQEVGLFPHLSVAENIAITPKLMGEGKAALAGRVAELLDLVALPRAFANRRPAALSGGQRQRVGVARALAAKPKVMLMDEPFGALDPVTRDALGGEYRKLHDQLGLTTLMVTHDITEAVLLADRILVMGEGRVSAEGTPAELLASSDPDVRALIETPRRQAERVRQRLEAAHG